MELFCACPFSVATLAWQPTEGQRNLSVCVKGTFVLAPGTSMLAPIQDPVGSEGATGDAPDLVPFKPRAEILFTGHAYAPNGGMSDSLIARARIGSFRKALSVNGDRSWVPAFDGLRPSSAVPFRRMPLVYERAVRTGENLAGVDISRGAGPNQPLANIAAIADQGGETPGLAALPFGWRTHRLGLSDHAILWAARGGIALGPPPARFDFRVFNAAPFEQQVDEIAPGCDVMLENLHPQLAALETRLPWIRVRMFQKTQRSEPSREIVARCDTLSIDTDRGVATTLWRGLARADKAGWIVVVADTEAETTRASDVDRMIDEVAPNVVYLEPRLLSGRAPLAPSVPDPIPVAPGRPPATTPPARQGRAPSTLAPPAGEEPVPLGALPFRAQPTGFDTSDLDLPTPHPIRGGTDEEVTPPRGYPAPPPPLSTPSTPPLTDAVYASVRVEAWRGRALPEALRQRNILASVYAGFESTLEDALALEARSGASARATALLDALFAARA